MSNKRRVAEQNLGVFLNPGGPAAQSGFMVPMGNLNVGPGEPGPGDEWHMPMEPGEIEDEGTAGRVAPERTAVLPLHPDDKG
jgi:hypothetical protein